jgi:hypothetical protein
MPPEREEAAVKAAKQVKSVKQEVFMMSCKNVVMRGFEVCRSTGLAKLLK